MKKISLLLFLLPCIFLLSCNSKYPGFSRTGTGLYYKFHSENEKAQKPKIGDILTFKMTYLTKDSSLFNSVPDEIYYEFDAASFKFKGDISECLSMMHQGDSATFIISGDSLMRFGYIPQIDSGLMVYYDIKLVKIQNSADFEKEQEQIRKLEEETQEKMKKIESETIGKYVKDNNIRVKPLESGMYFIPKKLGRGPKADIGEFVEVHYSAETLEGEKLFSSHSGKDESITFEMGSGFAIPGVEEGLKMMNAGSTARLIVPFSMAYGAKGLKNVVQPYCPLIYDLELISIMDSTVYKTKMETLEEEKIAKYLKENNITTAPDQYGLYYIELKKGNGRAGAEGKTVKINYTGKLLDGSVLHSSSENGSPVEFKVGEGEVIQGWDIAMTYMKQGGRAKLIIPSKLAFGDGYTGIVAPYTPLVYEIELLSVK